MAGLQNGLQLRLHVKLNGVLQRGEEAWTEAGKRPRMQGPEAAQVEADKRGVWRQRWKEIGTTGQVDNREERRAKMIEEEKKLSILLYEQSHQILKIDEVAINTSLSTETPLITQSTTLLKFRIWELNKKKLRRYRDS